MGSGWGIRRHRVLEIAAIALLLCSAMLDPVLTFGLAAAVLAAGLVLVHLERADNGRGR
jgi:hypothetical protein